MALYPSDWTKAPAHAHAYRATTSEAEGHIHLIEGFSQPHEWKQYRSACPFLFRDYVL